MNAEGRGLPKNDAEQSGAKRLDLGGMRWFGGGLFYLIWALIGANRVGW